MAISDATRKKFADTPPTETVELPFCFNDKDIEEMATLIDKYGHTRVSLGSGNITSKGIVPLARCKTLVYLGLNQNNLGLDDHKDDRGVRLLLRELPNLRELDVCDNSLIEETAQKILEKIQEKGPENFRANVYGNNDVRKETADAIFAYTKQFQYEFTSTAKAAEPASAAASTQTPQAGSQNKWSKLRNKFRSNKESQRLLDEDEASRPDDKKTISSSKKA